MPLDHPSSHFGAQDDDDTPASRDSALTVFAQLGAIRLGTKRAMISLFDYTHQHILAEAVRELSISGDQAPNDKNGLLLGCRAVPKDQGFCHRLLDASSRETLPEDDALLERGAMVVLDAKKDERFKGSSLHGALAETRFYAAVPIISPKEVAIGSYCVMDPQSRTEGLDESDLQFMEDMSRTVMNHLDLKQSKRRNRQTNRMVVGLGSFVEGKATLRDSWQEASQQHSAMEQSGEAQEGQLNKQQQDILEEETATRTARSVARRDFSVSPAKDKKRPSIPTDPPARSSSAGLPVRFKGPPESPQQPKDGRRPSMQFKSDDSPAENTDVHSVAIKEVFSRASNLIRESVEAEGVVFFDTSNVAFGGSVIDEKRRKVSGDDSRGEDSQEDESWEEGGSSSDDNRGSLPGSQEQYRPPNKSEQDQESNLSMCRMLGHSTTMGSSINNESMKSQHFVITEKLLKGLLGRYPRGRIFNYHSDQTISDDLSSDGSMSRPRFSRADLIDNPTDANEERPRTRRKHSRTSVKEDAETLIRVFPDATSILLLPVTDFPNSGCYAACLVWTNNLSRIFSSEYELTYISAFGNSIMAEIHRLDVEMAEKAKTNLVSSISHELRNPLHGILGTADILSDTAMNALQHGMVHTIESCGRTLLDTINHLLEFASVKKSRRWPQQNRRRRPDLRGQDISANPKQGLMSSKEDNSDKTVVNVKLDSILEEVIESVFAGYCFYNHPRARPQALDQTGRKATQATLPLGPVTVIFDMQGAGQWSFDTQPGAWRRILMNLLGNALKYTTSGFIYLGVKSLEKPDAALDKEDPEARQYDVILTVRDTGKGIGSKYLQKDLFTPFTQEDGLASGSGLGLSIVRQAVRSLNGSIDVSSSPGEGTEFSIQTTLTHRDVPTHSEDPRAESDFGDLQALTSGKKIGLIGFQAELVTERDKTMYSSLRRLCRDWFAMEAVSVPAMEDERSQAIMDFYLVIKTDLDHANEEERQLNRIDKYFAEERGITSPIVVLCPSPEHAHNMFAAAKGRKETTLFEFISQPCGPRKLAKALDLCMKRQGDQNGQDEPTRWVELPESSHIPVDIQSMDRADERITISKRPTTETMQSPRRPVARANTRDQDSQTVDTEDNNNTSHGPILPKSAAIDFAKTKTTVLLVDDNDLNLQLLVAQVKRENYNHMSGKDGLQAWEIYKNYPERIGTIVIGTYIVFFSWGYFRGAKLMTNRSFNARDGWN